MKPLGTALVYVVVLYGLDAYWFDGHYFTAAAVGAMAEQQSRQADEKPQNQTSPA